jgi:predicted ester cyclase
MTETKNVVREFISRLDMDHLPAVDQFFRGDCKFFLPGNHEAVDCERFKSFVGMLYTAFPDLHHEILEQIGENDSVVTLLKVRGTHLGPFLSIPPTGKEIVFTDIVVARFRENEIIELNAQFDALTLLGEIGALQL